jgi:peptide/nickel transport system substrate-binding protein
MKMLRIGRLLRGLGLAGAAAMLIAGLAPRATQAETILRLAIPADPIMNPVIGTDAAAVPLNRFLYDFLTRPDPQTLEARPGIATSWSATNNGRSWTFKLVHNAKWHDGKPFTADDVKFTYDVILDKTQNSPRRSAIAIIKEVKVLDAYTVQFELSEPLASFPSIASYNVGIVPKHLLEGQELAKTADFNTRHPVSTGPYKIVEAVPGDHYTFEATGDYFGGKPKIDRVIFKVIPEVNNQVAQLQSGELDFAVIQPTNLPAVQGSSLLKVQSVPFLGFEHVSFNSNDPLFSDKRVRQAMVYALDRGGILRSILSGHGTLSTGPIPPLFGWAYDKELKPYPFDPAKAQALLREAGWVKGSDGVLKKDGRPFAFELGVDKGNPTRERIALVAQQAYQALGMKVDLKVVEWPVYVKNLLSRTWVAHAGFWVLPPDPDLTNYYAPGQSFNTVNYNNPEVTKLLQQGRQVVDLKERTKIYKKLQEVMYNDPPGAILFYPMDIRAMKKDLTVPPLPFREALQWREIWSY